MGSILSGPKTPKAPPVPEPKPMPEQADSESVKKDTRKSRATKSKNQGRSSTFLRQGMGGDKENL